MTTLNIQENNGWYILDGHGCWAIFFARTFREVLVEAQWRGHLFLFGEKVLRFDEHGAPVIDESVGGIMSLDIPGAGWEFKA